MITLRDNSVGIGLRNSLMNQLLEQPPKEIDFFEIAPENWMAQGPKKRAKLTPFLTSYPFVCHGLSLSLGGPDPLDEVFLHEIKTFLDTHHIQCYTEHLSYSALNGHLYDLLPMPLCEEAVTHVAERIRHTQDILERRIGIENVSYYCTPSNELTELDFINAVLAEADCDLMLDVNNIYVNSINHQYNAFDFIKKLNPKHIPYCHIAGHKQKSKQLIIDSHGSNIIDPVWNLLDAVYAKFGVRPTLIERDNDIPPLSDLLEEVKTAKKIQKRYIKTPETEEAFVYV